MKKNKQIRFFVLLTSLFFSLNVLAENTSIYDPTNDLLEAFSGGCTVKSNGFAEQARKQGRSLRSIYKKIENSEACNEVASTAAELEAALYDQQANTNEKKNDILEKERLIADFEIAVFYEKQKDDADQDSSFLFAAESEISSLKSEIITAKTNPSNYKRSLRVENVQHIERIASQLLTDINNSKACLDANPNLPGKIAGQVLGITSTFNPGILGAILLSSGSLVSNFMRFLTKQANVLNEKQLILSSLTDAVGCTLESLASTHCKAEDTRAIIVAKQRERDTVVHSCNQSVIGARVIYNDLDILMDWTRRLSLTSSNFDNELSASYKSYMLKTTKTSFKSSIHNAREKLRKELEERKGSTISEDPSIRIRENLILNINNNFALDDLKNEMFTNDKYCGLMMYLFTKGKLKKRVKIGDTQPHLNSRDCENYYKINKDDKIFTELPTIDQVEILLNQIVNRANEVVARKLRKLQVSDVNLVFAKGVDKYKYGANPFEVLQSLQSYLNYILSTLDKNDPTEKQVSISIEKTLKRINSVILETMRIYSKSKFIGAEDLSAEVNTKKVDAGEIAVTLKNLLLADDDGLRFTGVLDEILQFDLQRKRKLGQNNDVTAMLAAMSNITSITALLNSFEDADKEAITMDSAMIQTYDQLTSFGTKFGSHINAILRDLKHKETNLPAFKRTLDISCVRSLIFPELPDAAKEICLGRSYASVAYERRINFDDFAHRPYQQRVCVLHDFFRQSRLSKQLAEEFDVEAPQSVRYPPERTEAEAKSQTDKKRKNNTKVEQDKSKTANKEPSCKYKNDYGVVVDNCGEVGEETEHN